MFCGPQDSTRLSVHMAVSRYWRNLDFWVNVQSDSSIRRIKSSSTCEDPVVEKPMTPFLVTFGQNVDHSVRLTPEANVALMNFV